MVVCFWLMTSWALARMTPQMKKATTTPATKARVGLCLRAMASMSTLHELELGQADGLLGPAPGRGLDGLDHPAPGGRLLPGHGHEDAVDLGAGPVEVQGRADAA